MDVGVTYTTPGFQLSYDTDTTSGLVTFKYTALNFSGIANFPTITISDSITTTYQADITAKVFAGVAPTMSPNVRDAETPLRLWKSEALQDAGTLAHLAENNYINPLQADRNQGPGAENWERYYVRLPLDYGRNGAVWQKAALVCQDFAYWGSAIEAQVLSCSPEENLPVVYESLFLYDDEPIGEYEYVYCEPYLYSNIGYYSLIGTADYANAGIFPATPVPYDEFYEATTTDYDPLHVRQADVTSPVNAGYGDWVGDYVKVNPCIQLTGFLQDDLLSEGVTPVAAPVWDASIYKFAPTCENNPASYDVDMNHFKVGYAYFVADASCAEDGFFDFQQEAAWRFPTDQTRTLYLTPQ
jgi:hypothetical protein